MANRSIKRFKLSCRLESMKCTAIKLAKRERNFGNVKTLKENDSSAVFTGQETHSYSFPFLNKQKSPKSINLVINNLNLPENIQSFNTGSSLEKWSKKRPRLKSAKISKSPTEDDRDFCYETLETDLSLLLNESDESPKSDDSLNNLQYEVHSDIEKLLQESSRSVEETEDEAKLKKRKKKRGKKDKNKIIKFSLSKPPSPQTEQVIRVDVTSSVSNEDKSRVIETKKNEDNNNCLNEDFIDDKRKELKRNLEKNTEMCDEDFIVRCKQLALRQRRRRL